MFTEEQLTDLLKGNAATASKLETPRAISLTGKAVGSTSFDGSNNASINVTSVNADTATNADKLDGYHASDLIDLINTNKTEIGNKISLHNTDLTAHADIRKMFDSYLTLTGGTVTGTLNVPTQATTDTSTKVANTAFVQSVVDNKVSQLVNSAPETLNTLNELSNALGNDPNFATTVADMIGLKEDKTVVNTKLSTHNTDSSAHTAILNAIKAISGMSAYDIAPSKTIATMIPLLGFGGIVAQRLEDTGYVKFANGFTIQWGWGQNSAYYPIAFTKHSTALPVHAGTNGYVNTVISYDSDLTKIVAGFGGAKNDGVFRYIAVGV